MNRAPYSAIKQDAKSRMSGHFGEAFLALLLIPFAFGTARSMISWFFTNTQVVGSIVDFFIVVLILYITLNLALKLSKGKYSSLFVNIMGDRNTYLNLFLYSLIASAIAIFPIYIFTDYITSVSEYFAYLSAAELEVLSPNEFSNVFRDFMPSSQLLLISFALIVIGVIIRIKLYLAPYLIIDRNMKAIDAIKLSWNYTSGNFLRIFFFPLSFILWYLLIFVTCGLILIYVIPYVSISHASFYNRLLIENGDYAQDIKEQEITEKINPLKKADPFDDYYE